MNISQFNISVTQATSFLKHCELFRMKGIKSLVENGVSEEFKNASQKGKYFEAYSKGLEKYDFDILLEDQSYFQFEFTAHAESYEIRYAFFQNPVEYVTYKEYLQAEVSSGNLEEPIEDIGEMFRTEYQQFLDEQETSSVYTTIRYDTDFPNYSPLIHSVSHIHIGHRNFVRIPVDKFLSPLKFVLFVIKHVYYSLWRDLVTTEVEYVKELYKESETGSEHLDAEKWIDLEKLDLFIT
jgi:hypothetical protein